LPVQPAGKENPAGLHAGAYLQLVEDVPDVDADRAFAQEQVLPDLPVGQALGHRGQQVQQQLGQVSGRRRPLLRRGIGGVDGQLVLHFGEHRAPRGRQVAGSAQIHVALARAVGPVGQFRDQDKCLQMVAVPVRRFCGILDHAGALGGPARR
jgi:hypothetical protein